MPASRTAFAPGRVNVIGEHTDYNGGLALPFAIREGVTVEATALAPGSDRVEVRATDLGEHDSFPLREPGRAGGWRAFVRGAVAELDAAGRPLVAMRVEIAATVPRGAGLSSSAALTVSLCLAMTALADGPDAGALDRLELARLCSRVENDWTGAHTGLLDQLASLYGDADEAMRIDFAELTVTPVPLRLHGWRFAVADSGQRHAHASSGYNERRAECASACEQLGVTTLSEADAAQVAMLPEPLRRRARHVLGENERVREAVQALQAGDIRSLAALLDASHASLRDLYEVSTPAVEATVAALHAAGAAGARVMGGGFGGAVLALLPPGTELPAGATEVAPGPGAHVL